MPHHLLIGAGPVATNAVETIRAIDGGASQITLVCDEPAHSRMALPYWLSGQIPKEQTHTGDEAYFRDLKVDTRLGERVTQIDAQARSVSLAGGDRLAFDHLLIATGASPLVPPIPGHDLSGVQTLWTLADTEALLDRGQPLAKPRVVMVGAGFIGFIMLNAMFKKGWQLAVVEREPHVLPRMLPSQAARFVQDWLAERGIACHCGASVQAIREGDDGAKHVQLDNGTSLEADVVVLATGIRPNLECVDGTGIDTDLGILVDDQMRTNLPDVYAGGDVAQGPVLYSEQRQIHAIQPTAVDHGRIAGANMAGQEVHYPGSLLMNVLDACGLQCASFGAWDEPGAAARTIHNAGRSLFRSFVWEDDRLVGAVFVGRANDVGMLTDVGMVKGILQTQTSLGEWRAYLDENPFDIRRPYVACRVAEKLVGTTLLGSPAKPRGFRFGGSPATTPPNPNHRIYVDTQ